MVGSFIRIAAAVAVSALLAGCASGPVSSYAPEYSDATRTETDSPLQCVPFAREQTGIPIYGDAYTWWDKAAGRYARSSLPSEGAIMVLYGYAGPNRAHLAVVKRFAGEREIIVDHANWLDDGAIYLNDPVQDVSAAGDWSRVRVFNIQTGAWGSRIYAVQGFIGPGRDSGTLRLAQNPTPTVPLEDPIGALIASGQDPPLDEY